MNTDPSKIIEFTDFQKLGDTIEAHCEKLIKKNHKKPLDENPIISHDFPNELKLGFECKKTGTIWRIRIKKLRDNIKLMGDKGELLRLALMTQEGKINLAESFYSAALKKISSK